ncbi:hypothetical protein G7046_g2594 [Stylonectria norvegica]|nr:hypothetical protein G7046_g2594 [Stylonectria norvegica]
MSPIGSVDAFASNTTPVAHIPATQTVLLLHGVRQQYQVTDGYAIPSTTHDHELLVRSSTIGLNPIDWKSPDFGFGIPELPYISGREATGVVVIVISTDYRDLRKATYQQFVVASDFNVVRIPKEITLSEGATMGVAFVAASLALGICLGVDFTQAHHGPNILSLVRSIPEESLPADIRDECLNGTLPSEGAQPGDWIAIWGGSSTSASIAVQLARLVGLRVALVVDNAKHGLRISQDPVLRPDLLVDSHDPDRAVAILRANTKGKLRFGIDTRGCDTAELLLRALGPEELHRKTAQADSPPSTPPAEPSVPAHLVGLSGLPKGEQPVGVVFHTIPVKLFHEVPEIGEALSCWLETLLSTRAITPPRIIDIEDGLHSVNKGLDRMRRGEISGGKLLIDVTLPASTPPEASFNRDTRSLPMSSRSFSEEAVQQPLLTNQHDEDDRERTAGRSPPPPGSKRGTFTKNLGAIEAFAIVISIVIGSGVFTSPGSIDTNVPSPGAALVIWAVGGLLAFTGALTMAELGTAIPGEGGVQPYLRYIFGDVFGFLAAWTWIVGVMPATLAILSIVFVESIFSAKGVTDQAGSIKHKLLSILILVIVNIANSISTKASTRLNNFFVTIKFITIFATVLAGVVVVILQTSDHDRDVGGGDWFKKPWFGFRNTIAPDGSEIDWAKLGQWDMLGHYSAALYGALWAYSGWDKAIYITAELSAPARQLPLALNTSIPTIILCFIATNAAYYILLPWDVVSTTDSVAVTAITRLLGTGFGIIAAIMICLVVAGSLLGNSFVGGRMAVAAANANWLPRVFGVVGQVGLGSRTNTGLRDSSPSATTKSKSDAPINAIILSTILSTLYILLGNFRALLTFNGLGEYSFFFLTVLGALILRYREPQLHRPYKPYALIPAVFAVVSGFVVVRGAIFAPVQAAVLVAVWGVGLAFYYIRRWRTHQD